MGLCWGFGFARHVQALGGPAPGDPTARAQVVEALRRIAALAGGEVQDALDEQPPELVEVWGDSGARPLVGPDADRLLSLLARRGGSAPASAFVQLDVREGGVFAPIQPDEAVVELPWGRTITVRSVYHLGALCEWLIDEDENPDNQDRDAHRALREDARAAGRACNFLIVS